MNMDFRREIASIKARYAKFEENGEYRSTWAPFNSEEADVRAQQMLSFSRLMRTAGYRDLDGLRILDVGCGSGRHLRQFIDMGARSGELVGIELDEAAVSKANRISPNLQIILVDGVSIPFTQDSFDLVTHHFVFSSALSDALKQQLIAEVRRVLKPGGLFCWWDIQFMTSAAGGKSINLDFETLIPEAPITNLQVAMTPRPSETLRPLPGLRKFLGPSLDRLGNKRQFQAALFRL